MKTKTFFFLPLFIFSLWSCEQEKIELVDELALSAVGLPGTWQVLHFEDESGNTVISSPEDEEIVLTIDSSSFEGTTERNEFEGEYQVQAKNRILFTEYVSTEEEETDFGKIFYDAMRTGQTQPMPFEINKNLLKINYEEGQLMILRRL